LYPNENATWLQEDCFGKYEFLGLILGKLLYEMIPVELPLAEFFLEQLIGTPSKQNMPTLSDLYTYDNEQYLSFYEVQNNTKPDEIMELELDFSTIHKNKLTEEVKTIDLVPLSLKKGKEIKKVTKSNFELFISCYIHHHLQGVIAPHVAAFRKGLEYVIPGNWISYFNSFEFEFLIGGNKGSIDIDDWRSNSKFSNGFYSDHPTIVLFWIVVSEFTSEEQSLLLKFVTSCSRPPLLGFKHLQPPFCLHQSEMDRLPSSTTCFNQLKLPPYDNYDQMREKLLFVINSNSGFELS
jgi:ubiquitin-protein ligase E3 C